MNRRLGVCAVMVAALLTLCACAERSPSRGSAGGVRPDDAQTSGTEAPEGEAPAGNVQGESHTQGEQDYIGQLVRETIARFEEPEMGEFEKAKAAFDYMIETTTLVDPVGLDLWRVRGDYREPPSYLENRSLSVLLFRVGKCEDYAAAFTMLLRGMGLEAEYVPGLTYSTQGELVDHAWTVAKIDGTWYHLDCQLEQNISRHGSIRYKYFMRSDATMAGSHRWGQNLIDSRLLTGEQNDEIARNHLLPACPQDYPTPARHDFTLPDAPDVGALQAAVQEEFRAYESSYGPLEQLELNVIPPVFALEGYGPQD